MRKIRSIVFDVPAEYGGALTILEQYYEKAIKDIENDWIFVVSIPDLKETNNIKILRYPWVKKSWFHRLYFDNFIAQKIIEQNKVDEIISLQNVIIKHVKVKQTLYLHQSLPFVEKRYGLFENYKYWLYQNIISKMIFKSIKEADKVIVQTKWIKNACLKKVDTNSDKFEVIQPDVNIKIINNYKQESEKRKLFFYPASGAEYKNHGSIIYATKELIRRGFTNFRVVFTLTGKENKNIIRLCNVAKKHNLPIEFIGLIKIEEVYGYYSKSVLVFPSYIETFGLPLLEAKMHNAPILASDCAFSHEILDDYINVEFFDPTNINELANLIEKELKK